MTTQHQLYRYHTPSAARLFDILNPPEREDNETEPEIEDLQDLNLPRRAIRLCDE